MQGRTLMLNERMKATSGLERGLVLVERMLQKCPDEVGHPNPECLCPAAY